MDFQISSLCDEPNTQLSKALHERVGNSVIPVKTVSLVHHHDVDVAGFHSSHQIR
jgi:hypothetical protein